MEELIRAIIEEKATATNKEKMGILVDKALDALKKAVQLTSEEKVTAKVADYEDTLKAMAQAKDAVDKELMSQHQSSGSIIDILNAEITTLKENNADLKAKLDDVEAFATDLVKEYNQEPANSAKLLTVKLKKGKATINHGVNYKGINYTAANLADNKEVAEELFAMGSGAITLLED